MFRDPADARPGYFVEVDFTGGRIARIRDFRYVPYIALEATFESPIRNPIPPIVK